MTQPRRAILSALAAGCLLLIASAVLAHGGDEHDHDVTLTGEILDLHCYLLHPETGHGPDHAKCANSCIDRGLPAGFLADGRVYVLLGPGHGSPREVVAGHAGKPVKLTGKLVEQGGVMALQVKSVEEAAGHDHAGHDHDHDH